MTAPTVTSVAATLAALDAAHRVKQAANAERVAQLVLAYFLTRVDGENLSGTVGDWLDFSVGQIKRGYERAHLLSVAYTRAVQDVYIPGAEPIEIPPLPPVPEEKLRRSLSYTGPGTVAVELKKTPEALEPPRGATAQETERYERAKTSRGERIKIVMEKGAAAASATTYKNVFNGHRDTTDLLVVRKQIVGYLRVTKDNPCGFCLLLASRGPVYREDSFAESDARFTGPGNHKVHDSCGCMLRPLFSRVPENWTSQARQADDLWKAVGKETGKTGNDAINEFRNRARKMGIADLTRY